MGKDEILQAIQDGYKGFSSGRTEEVAAIWLPAWNAARDLLAQKGCKSEKEIRDFLGEDFLNWFFDLDVVLMENGMHNERLDFNRYLMAMPGYLDPDNPRMNVAESLASLNRLEEAESMLSGWLEADPFWGSGWTCRANILLDNDRKDRALEIIEQGMTMMESSADADNLELFYQNAELVYRRLGKMEKADYCARKARESSSDIESKQMPAVSIKVGRNDPCPCGSGKKYKKCCGR